MLVFDLLAKVGHRRFEDARRRRVAALFVPTPIDEAHCHFRLRADQTEKAAVFPDMGRAGCPHAIEQHVVELGSWASLARTTRSRFFRCDMRSGAVWPA